MTTVTSRVLVSTVYEWVVPTDPLTGDPKSTEYDDWLKVTPRDEDIVFWFEWREAMPS